MFASKNLFFKTAAAVTSYQISRSLRFNAARGTYLTRTPASNGNLQIFTISVWAKRNRTAVTGTEQLLRTLSAEDALRYEEPTSADQLCFYLAAKSGANLVTNAVYRDLSAWHHILIAVDTTQATASNRIKMYVNGLQVTSFATATYPSQNYTCGINSTTAHAIGAAPGGGSNGAFSGYMADFYIIDGQALTPTSFGQFDAATGVWVPIAYSGSYGTNGFHLPFSDNSGTTATTLGKDTSGNGNNFTPNNFSVTAGAGNDSLVDSPTNYGTDTGAGGEVRGNYAILNALMNNASYPSVISNGNLDAVSNASSNGSSLMGTIAISSGKWYWEYVVTSNTQAGNKMGIVGTQFNPNFQADSYFVYFSYGYGYQANGQKANNNTFTSYGATYTNGDVIGCAFDADGGNLTFYKNGVSQGTAFTGISGTFYPVIYGYASSAMSVNFGQRPFAYTAPSGFKALCSANLPLPTIGTSSTTQASNYMNVSLYTGTGATQSITGLSFQPDLVWLKSRSNALDHKLTDVLRGVTKGLISDTTGAETTDTNGLTAFNSNGFTIGSDATYNTNAATYVGWSWKAGGAGSSNTSGSITSTVSANTTAGFSVVTYAGTGANATVGHGLGVAPSMIIVKSRTNGNANYGWGVYHKYDNATPQNGILVLNSTQGFTTDATGWNNTAPTSSVFSIGTGLYVNGSSNNFVAYCFSEVTGFSKFGSYTGNGSADGPFVYCGFRPRYVLTKRTDTTGNWFVWDTARNTYNVVGEELYPSLSNAGSTATDLDVLSNGFKFRGTTADYNASGGTYIFMAFAESPFNYSRAR